MTDRIREELDIIENTVEFYVAEVEPAKKAFHAIDRIREKHLPAVLSSVEELEKEKKDCHRKLDAARDVIDRLRSKLEQRTEELTEIMKGSEY